MSSLPRASSTRPSLQSVVKAVAVACAFAVSAARPEGAAAESVQRSITVRADVASRTTLRVSAEMVRFHVLNTAVPATASIDFAAGARTQAAGEVIFTIEPLGWTEAPDVDGTAAPQAGAGFGRRDEEITAVDVSTPGRKVARRWVGSGLRHGTVRLVFRATKPGYYEVHLRVFLSAP